MITDQLKTYRRSSPLVEVVMLPVSVFRYLVFTLAFLLLVPLPLQAEIEDESFAATLKKLDEPLLSLTPAPLNSSNDDLQLAVRLYPTKDRAKAYGLFKSAAERGNPAAQYVVGLMYRIGEGVPQKHTEAVHWFGMAAANGHLEAMFNLGVMYSLTIEVPASREKAVYWYRKAAEKGHAPSQVNLGAIYDQRGDYSEAYRCFREAAKKGHYLAEYNLGLQFLRGAGVIRNFAAAERWFSKAAEHGSSAAQYELGRMYQNGVGVRKDLNQAISWYEKAAAQGNMKGKVALEEVKNSL